MNERRDGRTAEWMKSRWSFESSARVSLRERWGIASRGISLWGRENYESRRMACARGCNEPRRAPALSYCAPRCIHGVPLIVEIEGETSGKPGRFSIENSSTISLNFASLEFYQSLELFCYNIVNQRIINLWNKAPLENSSELRDNCHQTML